MDKKKPLLVLELKCGVFLFFFFLSLMETFRNNSDIDLTESRQK